MANFTEYVTNPAFLKTSSNMLGEYNEIFVYVEDESDINFWSKILNKYDKKISIKPAAKACNGSSGKLSLLTSDLFNGLNEEVFFAVDADYDYLCFNENITYDTDKINDELIYKMNISKYVIHTVLYSRESYYLDDSILHNVLNDIPYTQENRINIDYFFTLFSNAIYEILSRFLWLKRNNATGIIKQDTVEGYISDILRPSIQSLGENKINEELLQSKVLELDELIQDNEGYFSYLEELQTLGFTRENSYKFLSGHYAYEKILQNGIVKRWMDSLRKKALTENSKQDFPNEMEKSQRRSKIINHFKSKEKSFKDNCRTQSLNLEDVFVKKIFEQIDPILL